jgi:hypothetical protein
LEKSDKFSKIPTSHDLCQNEFSWVHLDVRFQVTKQVPNDLVRIKELSLNLKFNPYNISWTVKLARISFKLPNYIASYYSGIVEHCSSYSNARGVTVISLEDASTNWYCRLPPCCIHSWQQLKDKILLNFQGFQAELDTKEDFLSCVQKEREPLLNFYQRFLQLKAQAPEVSDAQVIAQAIKALRAGPLHNHLIRERPRIVPELYDQFAKFSKSKI